MIFGGLSVFVDEWFVDSRFALPKAEDIRTLKIVFESSYDTYGRIVVYKLDVKS